MSLEISQKERMLLEDEQHQEEICVKKYKSFAEQASDKELKQLLNKLAGEEQHHYDMITKMLNGQDPGLNQNQQQGQQSQQQGQQQNQYTVDQQGFGNAMSNQGDEVLCSDLLATEKYVSGTYDTTVFEAANPTVRQALQHIQQEEQGHGQQLFEYMHSHGMYPVK